MTPQPCSRPPCCGRLRILSTGRRHTCFCGADSQRPAWAWHAAFRICPFAAGAPSDSQKWTFQSYIFIPVLFLLRSNRLSNHMSGPVPLPRCEFWFLLPLAVRTFQASLPSPVKGKCDPLQARGGIERGSGHTLGLAQGWTQNDVNSHYSDL